jgi:hypothetical protein
VRAQFEEESLDIDGFRRLVRAVANPCKWGPSFCRPRRGTSAKTAKRNTNDMLAVEEGRRHLIRRRGMQVSDLYPW